jgi:type II secretory pathway pseudopilin PulG
MPGLIRGVARTAVVAGTATAVAGRVSRRQQGRWAAQDQQAYEHEYYEQQQQQAYQQQQPYPQQGYPQPAAAPAAPAPANDMSDQIAQLKQLGELRDQGILSDQEFEAQKQKILGG